MPKMKTHKGLKKRIKITANGKVKHKRPNASHLMSGKSGSRVRHLKKHGVLNNVISKNIKINMGEA
ncbi:MAG: 50S ribosomal protein L35 [Phycisphaerales bacterium]|nr:50S ribosomal protein L35 [Phycisphaerales bacterium]